MEQLHFEYHADIDMLEVEGIHFSGDYFRHLAACQRGDFLVIRHNGATVCLECRPRRAGWTLRLWGWAKKLSELALIR